MIGRDDAFEDAHIPRVARLAHQIAAPLLHLASEHLVAVLRAEDEVDLEREDAMTAAALLHGLNLACAPEASR